MSVGEPVEPRDELRVDAVEAGASPLSHDPDRIAVVLVHGMGQQKPMGTLRDFVEEYLAGRGPDSRHKWSVADRYDRSFELHTFVVPPDKTRSAFVADVVALTPEELERKWPPQVKRPRSQVDFYEGYWASDLRGTKLAHIWAFVRDLVSRLLSRDCPVRVPLRLAWVWVPLVVLPLLAAVLIWWLMSHYGDSSWLSWLGSAASIVVLPALAGWVSQNAGDVARYLDDAPDNVAVRHAIRKNLVGLLRRLHEDGRYRRVVLIGHSLGGVVAYDALRLLWARQMRDVNVADLHQGDLVETATALKAAASQGDGGTEAQRRLRAKDDSEFGKLRAAHIKAQDSAFSDLAKIGHDLPNRLGRAWLVSDLITVGSPIAYPDLLIADPGISVDKLTKERLLPTSPPRRVGSVNDPQLDDGADTDDPECMYTYNDAAGDDEPSLSVFHHGAVFAVTRWTNIYADADFVGNEVPDSLGVAVTNRRLGRTPMSACRWARIPYFSHTRYWKEAEGRNELWEVIERSARSAPLTSPYGRDAKVAHASETSWEPTTTSSAPALIEIDSASGQVSAASTVETK